MTSKFHTNHVAKQKDLGKIIRCCFIRSFESDEIRILKLYSGNTIPLHYSIENLTTYPGVVYIMIDSYGRSFYQKVVVSPFIPIFLSLSPTTITCFALLSGISILPLLYLQHTHFAVIMLLLSGFFDTMDGTIARLRKQASPFGAALDITSDRIVEFCIILGLYFYDPSNRALNCLLMLGSILFCITSFLVVGIFKENTSEKGFHYSPGLMERTEAFIFFCFMMMFPYLFVPISFTFSLLVFTTGLTRLMQFQRIFIGK